MKKIFALMLTIALSLTPCAPALAAGTEEKFPATRAYSGFSDVAADHWAYDSIKICFEIGLVNGKGEGFDPDGNVTIAEALTVAARVGASLRKESVPASTNGVWFSGSLSYLLNLPGGDAITVTEDRGQEIVSRHALLRYLAVAVPEEALTMKNSITALPDVSDAEVLRFYNAGVLSGMNEYGTFVGKMPLSRAEMAAMVARIARPETALAFTPKGKDTPDFDPIVYYTGLNGSDPAIIGDDVSVSIEAFLPYYAAAVRELVSLCEEQGVAFSWSLGFEGGKAFPKEAEDNAVSACLSELWETDFSEQETYQDWLSSQNLKYTRAFIALNLPFLYDNYLAHL